MRIIISVHDIQKCSVHRSVGIFIMNKAYTYKSLYLSIVCAASLKQGRTYCGMLLRTKMPPMSRTDKVLYNQ